MRLAAGVVVCLLSAPAALAQDGERFVERTPYPKHPIPHTMERAGCPNAVAWWAIPAVTRFEGGGYVGGGSVCGNRVLAKGPYSAPGPVQDGTFGWDFIGFKLRPGRVFLAASPDPSCGPAVTQNYRSDGPRVLDVFSLRPVRKAVLEKKEEVGGHKGEH